MCFVNVVKSVDRVIHSIFQRFNLGRKSLGPSSCTTQSSTLRFDSIAESSQFANYFRSAPLLGPLADSRTPFLVSDLLVENQPDQAAKPMGDSPNSLLVSIARYRATIYELEDASLGLDRGISSLIENAPHMAVALRGPAASGYSRAFVVSGARANPRREVLG